MSYKFDSLIIILNKLDNKEKVTISSLKQDIEISERTAHRYLTTLQTAGFPIFYERKKESYEFIDGFSLKKPNLSVEETLAFALAKKFMKGFGEGFEKNLLSIEDKLSSKKKFPPASILVKTEEPSQSVDSYLHKIHEAIINFKSIEITYNASSANEETIRKIDPYYLFYYDGFWHVRGYCHLRKALRLFALDKIVTLKVFSEHFLPPDIFPEGELSRGFANVLDGKPVKVVLRFAKVSKPSILRKKWHQSQTQRVLEDGRLEMTFKVNGFGGIKKWIYRWLPYVEIVEPKELREMVSRELREAVRKNG